MITQLKFLFILSIILATGCSAQVEIEHDPIPKTKTVITVKVLDESDEVHLHHHVHVLEHAIHEEPTQVVSEPEPQHSNRSPRCEQLLKQHLEKLAEWEAIKKSVK